MRLASPRAASRLAHLERALANVTQLHRDLPPNFNVHGRQGVSYDARTADSSHRDYEQVMKRGVRSAADAFRGLRNLQFKRLTCRACGGAGQLPLTIGTLPYLHFASGHTFFTQSLQERNGFLPTCVHTTFQFGDTAEFTWGKRSRLREKSLWAVDDDGYYRRQGSGPHPSEATYEAHLP